jgi:ribose 5-phosphate isomerase B
MKIAIGCDHGGLELKKILVEFLKNEGHEVRDFGTHAKDSCDYPLIGFEVAKEVADGGVDRGILICKTGIGMAIIANKVHDVRAVACYDVAMAVSSREHNNCNVASLGASYTPADKAKEIVRAWLSTKHAGDRHARRVEQIKDIEQKLNGPAEGLSEKPAEKPAEKPTEGPTEGHPDGKS